MDVQEIKTAASFGAIILAGGYSSRMKAFKPLLSIGDSTAIEMLIAVLRDAGIADIAVVSGHNREALLPVIKRAGVSEVYNENYAAGMFSSIRAGLGYAKDVFTRAQGFFLMPVDCPLISRAVLVRLMRAAEAGLLGESDTALDEAARPLESNGAAVPKPVNDVGGPVKKSAAAKNFYVPVFEGKKGHPLLIPAAYSGEICGYDGPGGLKAITDQYWDRMVRIPVEDEGCLLDMDTPEGYEEILDFQKSGGRRESLQKLAAGRRIFLIRHGQTKQHAEKMFIGRYDVPLKEDSCGQVEAMAESLARVLADKEACKDASSCCASAAEAEASKRYSPAEHDSESALSGGIIYTSPLRRAEQTAEIIRAVLMQEEAHGGKAVAAEAAEDLMSGKAQSCHAGNQADTEAQMDCGNQSAAERQAGKRNADEGKNRLQWELQQVTDLQEIALGDWDGKPISEIKTKYPLEYEHRGADIFAFKTGNRAENFYDVQYRAVKALCRILAEDQSRDIVLVTHSTVIRALENNLIGLRVDDPWEQLPKNDFRVIKP